MVCGWPILDPFFQQLCSRQVMVAASLSLSLSLYVGIFISLCVLEYSAAYVCWNIQQPVCVGIFSFYMHVGIFCNMHVGIFCSMHVGIFCNMHVGFD
jgi:hypothetical protein